MDDGQIRDIMHEGMSKLIENDRWLLTHGISERSIAHKLAEYLQTLFSDDAYHVDCEYNGNVDHESGRKRVKMLYKSLEERGFITKRESQLEKELVERAVFPDIIVHKRGTNEHNLLIIEMKKSSSQVSHEYDAMKLYAYTSDYHGNQLKYQLGAFIVTEDMGGYTVTFYKDGERIVL